MYSRGSYVKQNRRMHIQMAAIEEKPADFDYYWDIVETAWTQGKGVVHMVDEQQPPGPPLSDELREKAEKRVSQKMALFSHIGSYVIVNGFLVLIWALTGAEGGNFWPVWVMLGWGIGLAFHVFGYITGKRSDAVRERMLQKELERVRREQGDS
jgi:hypothetical protein